MPQWTAGGVRLPDGPYLMGAGVCKNPVTTKKWLAIAPVVSGSYTAETRAGNQGNVLYPQTLEQFIKDGYGFNSYGMPNLSCAVAAIAFTGKKYEQPLVISVAGFSVDEYINAVQLFVSIDEVSAIELNFGCPNTQGEHQDIMSFNPGAVRKVLEGIVARGLTTKPIWLKFSPYSNPAELKRMADLVNRFADDLLMAVVTCNTFPNSYAGPGKIDPNNGLSGLSGPALKPIALGQVVQFRQHLDTRIDVIGVGGITTGDDVVDFLDAGAKAVQITSLAHWAGDSDTFYEHLLRQETASRFLEHLTDDI